MYSNHIILISYLNFRYLLIEILNSVNHFENSKRKNLESAIIYDIKYFILFPFYSFNPTNNTGEYMVVVLNFFIYFMYMYIWYLSTKEYITLYIYLGIHIYEQTISIKIGGKTPSKFNLK